MLHACRDTRYCNDGGYELDPFDNSPHTVSMTPCTDNHARFMNRAIRLARKGLFTAHPNPRVGCVLVKEGQIVGEGFHHKAGEGHAEINALAEAGDKAWGSRCYVTLEPCCHQGKTPPCTDALISAGIRDVIVAMEDPNPLVAGKGIAALENAGIKVAVGVCRQQAEGLNPGFIKRMKTGLPFVRVKIGASLDGWTAMASGESQWITGAASRKDVQKWRAMSSAIVTGIETVLADDPALTVRDPAFDTAGRQPLRVVLDSDHRFPDQAHMRSLPGENVILTTQESDHAEAVKIEAGSEGRVDLEKAMRYLADKKAINEVLVEAGSTLSGAFIQAGLVDELILYQAPKLLGGSARPLVDLPGLEKLADCVQLEIKSLKKIGKDIRIVATIREN